MAWDDALRVAAKLATAILEDSLKDRLSKTVLAWRKRQEDYEALLKVDHMLHLALLAARMLCTAIPGFRLFIWVPEDYGVQIKQVNQLMLCCPQTRLSHGMSTLQSSLPKLHAFLQLPVCWFSAKPNALLRQAAGPCYGVIRRVTFWHPVKAAGQYKRACCSIS